MQKLDPKLLYSVCPGGDFRTWRGHLLRTERSPLSSLELE